jgi:hypothetical protein
MSPGGGDAGVDTEADRPNLVKLKRAAGASRPLRPERKDMWRWRTIATDTRRFLGSHIFHRVRMKNGIEHRLTKPYCAWINGQAKRMNRTIKDVAGRRLKRFDRALGWAKWRSEPKASYTNGRLN